MSYTILDAKNDLNDVMISALNSDDSSYVYECAKTLAGVYGWEEEAEMLRKRSRQIEQDEWAYDEERDNNL